MISKKFRLPVQETRRSRPERTIPGELFTVRVYHGGNINRFGIVMSLKVDKRSVRRHFWKRRIIDAVARWPNVKKDFVIIASPRLRTARADDLAQALQAVADTFAGSYP